MGSLCFGQVWRTQRSGRFPRPTARDRVGLPILLVPLLAAALLVTMVFGLATANANWGSTGPQSNIAQAAARSEPLPHGVLAGRVKVRHRTWTVSGWRVTITNNKPGPENLTQEVEIKAKEGFRFRFRLHPGQYTVIVRRPNRRVCAKRSAQITARHETHIAFACT
jgi:hypothetical protein